MSIGAWRELADRYDPMGDAAERWSEWRFLTTPLRGVTSELISPQAKAVLIDQAWWDRDAAEALAHQIAHLDLGHHEDMGRPFTDEDERQAVWLAQVRLDREADRECP